MSSKKPNQKRLQRRGKRVRPMMDVKPPQLQTKITFSHRFRYACTTAGTNTLTFTDIFAVLAINTVATTSGVSAISALRLKKLQIWQLGTVSGGPGTISIETDATNNNSGIGSRSILLTDTSSNTWNYARLTYVPNKLSQQGQWQNTGTTANTTGGNTMLKITANVGDVMDIVLEIELNTMDPILAITKATGATIGTIGGFPLPVTTPAWNPVSFPTP